MTPEILAMLADSSTKGAAELRQDTNQVITQVNHLLDQETDPHRRDTLADARGYLRRARDCFAYMSICLDKTEDR